MILDYGKLCVLRTSLELRKTAVGRWLEIGIAASVLGIHRGRCITRASKPQRRQQAIHACNPVTPVYGRGQEGSQLGKR